MQDNDTPRSRRTRLSDIADATGFSTMTVSRVLREPDKVAPKTLKKVRRVLEQTGYTPDLLARGLASNRSGLVTVIIPVLTHSLIAEIVLGLINTLAEDDLHVVLGVSNFDIQEEEKLIRTFLSRRVDAIYLSGSTRTQQSRQMLQSAGIPVVEGGNLSKTPIDMTVGHSNFDGAYKTTKYLIERGYDPIAYIGIPHHGNDRAVDRKGGYEAALYDAGISPDPRHYVETSLDLTGGAQAMQRLLACRPRVRAVFCYSDAVAAGAIFECHRQGIAIPDTMAVAGYDDLEIARQMTPALTTLRVPCYEIGKRSGELICQRLAGKPVTEKIVDTVCELIIRESA